MCGISGLCCFAGDAKGAVHAVNEWMKDRGPDAEGIWTSADGAVTLGHRRLSIIDLSPAGSQPFRSADGRYTIVFNGEIYDYQKLRQKLLSEKKVTGFRGTSDTEALVEACGAFGVKKTLQMCKGMWAAAVYDSRCKTLTLTRDRVGEKPLYFGWVHTDNAADGRESFAFASDIGALTKIPGFSNRIRRDVLPLYFRYGYIPAPYTIYEDLYKLVPGSMLTLEAPYDKFDVPADLYGECHRTDSGCYEGKGFRYELYWSMRDAAVEGFRNPFRGTREEAANELERLLREAVRGQMVADVPLGAFLSAGIDSSTVVSVMQSLAPGKVRTFTIGMKDDAYDEAPAAAEIARHLGTEHTQLYISEQQAQSVIPKLAGMFGEPFADSSQIPTYLVSQMTREHVTVSLSGDAGDELFCGYRSYASLSRIWGKMQSVPYGVRRIAGAALLHNPLPEPSLYRTKGMLLQADGPLSLGRLQRNAEFGIRGRIPDEIALAGSAAKGSAAPAAAEEYLPELLLSDACRDAMLRDLLQYHPDDILVKVDRTAMAVSLETRVPLLDRDIVEFAWTLPVSYLRNDQEGKLVLKDVLYRYVPKSLLDRPKKGFSVPVKKWLLSSALRPFAEDLLQPDKIRRQGYLDAELVSRLWSDLTDRGIYRPQIWYILMFQNWLEKTIQNN